MSVALPSVLLALQLLQQMAHELVESELLVLRGIRLKPLLLAGVSGLLTTPGFHGQRLLLLSSNALSTARTMKNVLSQCRS